MKKYMEPTMEIVIFTSADVICTSDITSNSDIISNNEKGESKPGGKIGG